MTLEVLIPSEAALADMALKWLVGCPAWTCADHGDGHVGLFVVAAMQLLSRGKERRCGGCRQESGRTRWAS